MYSNECFFRGSASQRAVRPNFVACANAIEDKSGPTKFVLAHLLKG